MGTGVKLGENFLLAKISGHMVTPAYTLLMTKLTIFNDGHSEQKSLNW